MTISTTVPINVFPEAEARIAKLGMHSEVILKCSRSA
jgi:hypothetical protein